MAISTPARGLASQVARLFYDRQMSKMEIAALLGISRFRVARLIDRALADGLVRIEYRDLPAEDRDLASAIEQRFGLALCAVAAVRPAEGTSDVSIETTARLAGAVLDGLIGPNEVIGIAWGSTLAAVVREIPLRSESTIDVVQLAGSSTRLHRDRDAGELARVLAERLGGRPHVIYAPAFVETARLRSALVRQAEVAEATDRYAALTMAIVGVGAMPGPDGAASSASSLVRSGVLDPDSIARLVAAGAVGDLIVHPFDAAGSFVSPDLAERAIAIGVDELRAVPRVVAVAAGAGKAEAIQGALATGLIHILVTDAPTARAMLAGI